MVEEESSSVNSDPEAKVTTIQAQNDLDACLVFCLSDFGFKGTSQGLTLYCSYCHVMSLKSSNI